MTMNCNSVKATCNTRTSMEDLTLHVIYSWSPGETSNRYLKNTKKFTKLWNSERRVRCKTHCNIKILRYGLSYFFNRSKSRGKCNVYATSCNTTKHVFCCESKFMFFFFWFYIKRFILHAQHNPLVLVMDMNCVLCKAQNKLQNMSLIKVIYLYANCCVDILINIHILLFMVTFINW